MKKKHHRDRSFFWGGGIGTVLKYLEFLCWKKMSLRSNGSNIVPAMVGPYSKQNKTSTTIYPPGNINYTLVSRRVFSMYLTMPSSCWPPIFCFRHHFVSTKSSLESPGFFRNHPSEEVWTCASKPHLGDSTPSLVGILCHVSDHL